jgi:hypothetical protein
MSTVTNIRSQKSSHMSTPPQPDMHTCVEGMIGLPVTKTHTPPDELTKAKIDRIMATDHGQAVIEVLAAQPVPERSITAIPTEYLQFADTEVDARRPYRMAVYRSGFARRLFQRAVYLSGLENRILFVAGDSTAVRFYYTGGPDGWEGYGPVLQIEGAELIIDDPTRYPDAPTNPDDTVSY